MALPNHSHNYCSSIQVGFKIGFQKFKSKCKVEKDLSQSWEGEEILLYPMVGDFLTIKVGYHSDAVMWQGCMQGNWQHVSKLQHSYLRNRGAGV